MFLSREIDIKLCQFLYENSYICNFVQSENDNIPQEPENLRFAHITIFSFLIDIIDNIITYSPYITSPEFQPMAVEYTGHVISV